MSDDIFDFGFTAVDEDGPIFPRSKNADTRGNRPENGNQERLDKLYNAIVLFK